MPRAKVEKIETDGGEKKSKSRAKKPAAAVTKVLGGDEEVERPEPIKKPAAPRGRGKKAQSNEENENIEIVANGRETSPPKTTGRGKKTATGTKPDKVEVEVAATAPTKASKGRGKKEKLLPADEADEVPPVVQEESLKPVKGRAKKSKTPVDEEAMPAKKRAKKNIAPIEEEDVAAESIPQNGRKPTPTGEEPPKGRETKKATAEKIEKAVDKPEAVEVAANKEILKPVKGRAKKSPVDEEAVPAKKRGRKPTPTVEEPKEIEKAVDKPEVVEVAANKRAARGTKRTAALNVNYVEESSDATPTANKRVKKITKKSNKVDEIEEPTVENVGDALPAKTARGRKRVAVSVEKSEEVGDHSDDDDEIADGSKTSKAKNKKTTTSPKANSGVGGNYNSDDFKTTQDYNFKISSWNVAGLRAWIKKDGLQFLDHEEPDIFCMQETKCTVDQLPEEVVRLPGYHPYWLCMPGGHAGVAIYTKTMPIHVEYGIGNEEFDKSGRMITAEYEKFYLINVYVPNSGRKLVNLEPRMRWEKLFQSYVQKLDALKPVVICGDMNVSHSEIDLANPKSNTRSAGFTREERDKMTELLSLGFVDTFRNLYPKRSGAYTYWTYMANARSRNVGWRLDYCIVSERFVSRIVDNCIRSQCLGSDHCPITVLFNI